MGSLVYPICMISLEIVENVLQFESSCSKFGTKSRDVSAGCPSSMLRFIKVCN